MKFFQRRFYEEFFLYSSQFVLFFIIALFASPAIIRPDTIALVVLIGFLLMQTALLARNGHKPVQRLLFSCITPAAYSLTRILAGSSDLLDMASFFLWITALYLGAIQALGLLFKRKWPKRITEVFLSFGTIFTFVFFYFYLDLRLGVSKSYELGQIRYFELLKALSIDNFIPAFVRFAKPMQHIFFMFGALMFGLFQLSDKVKQISLKYRLDTIYATVEPPGIPIDTRTALGTGENREVVVLYADLWNFTPIAEKEGAAETIGLLNRYYALWDIVVRRNHGIIEQFVGDTVIAVFGLLGEKNPQDSAVACARDFLAEFIYFQEDLADHKLPIVKHIGIGIHAGKVVAGELTAASGQVRVAVIGETVNVAARLDSLCREFKQDLLLSQPVYKLLSLENQSLFQPMGEVLFRNKTQPQVVFGKK